MKDKPDEFEDKADKKPRRKKTEADAAADDDKETFVKPNRRGWDDASFEAVMSKYDGGDTVQHDRKIRMRTGRQWQLGDRLLKAGEQVELDESTAAAIVDAGYAIYTED